MKTKIICTLGSATESPEILEQLVIGGTDILRFNFSHTTEEQFHTVREHLAHIEKKHHKHVEILVDLQGPRIRVGELGEEGVTLTEGEEIRFSTDPSVGDAIYIQDPYLHEDIEVDHPVFLSNGDLELFITEKNGPVLTAKVLRGGVLYSRKGVNLPDTHLRTGGLTEKDFKDILFGVAEHVDYVAMSFVKDEGDMHKLRETIANEKIRIISKIERKQALSHLDSIIKASDIVMIARGDLGVEIPLEDLPIIQKVIIEKCKEHNIPAIVATQMLASMVNHHRPTRAEVSDVANAVLDGAWGVMLSDETASGNFPLQSLQYLVKTVERAEAFLLQKE